MAQEGFRVAAVDLSFDGDAVSGSRTFTRDIAEIDAHDALIEAVEGELGPVTCLVNNAGVTSLVRGDLLEMTPESYDRAMAVNLRAPFFLTQAVARRWTAAPRVRRTVVNMGSINADVVGDNRADYCISKAGVAMMTKLFATRLAGLGAAVFEIRPGIITTEMTRPAQAKYDALVAAGGVPMDRWGHPDDVAAVVAACALGHLPYMTGVHLDVAGGLQVHRI